MTGLLAIGLLALLCTGVVVAGVRFLTWLATPKRSTSRR